MACATASVLRAFQPCCNGWSEDTDGIKVDLTTDSTSYKILKIRGLLGKQPNLKVPEEGSPLCITDRTTGDKYIHFQKRGLRIQHAVDVVATPIIALAQCIYAITNIFRVVSLYHFRTISNLTPAQRFKNTAIDLARVVCAPLTVAGICLSSLYGIVAPYDSMKMLDAIHRASVGSPRSAKLPFYNPILQKELPPPDHV